MCNDEQTVLRDIDFTVLFSNDHPNWTTTSSNPVITSQNKLILNASDDSSQFMRFLGDLSNTKNRVELIIDLELKRKINGGDAEIRVEIEVVHNVSGQVLDTFSIVSENIGVADVVRYNFDRVFKYNELSGGCSLRVRYVEGSQIEMRLNYLKCTNYNYCADNIRTYFGFKNIFDSIEGASSVELNFLEYKINGVETLTNEYFAENQTPSSIPELLYANADIDGTPRVEQNQNNNSWNPFVSQSGLIFDTNEGFHIGKALGTISGSDYGNGILNVGLLKPVVLSGSLDRLNGAFFIDIDYTKNLKIVFDLIIAKGASQSTFRTYTIEWNANSCESEFTYLDRLRQNTLVDVNSNGFLIGLTGEERPVETIDCSEFIAKTERAGVSEFFVDFGSSIGEAGIDYDADDIPNKFELIYDGVTYSSGYVGSNSYDQQLLAMGIPPNEIQTGNPSTATGQLTFTKPSGNPTTGKVRVSSPFDSNYWRVDGICPSPVTGGNFRAIEIGVAECGEIPATTQTVFVNTGGVDSNLYELQNGDMLFEDLAGTIIFNGGGQTFRKKFDTGGGLVGFQQYQFDVSIIGVVLNKTVCEGGGNGGGGTNFILIDEQNCFTDGQITVEVPIGETRQVEITRSDSFGSNPVSETIAQTTVYDMRIEGSNQGGNNNTNSSMSVTVTNPITNQTVINDNFNRQHSGNIC